MKEWWQRKPGLLVTDWRQDVKHKKPLVGSEFDVVCFVPHFIPGARQVTSQLVCN
jgi:hypothetical protein